MPNIVEVLILLHWRWRQKVSANSHKYLPDYTAIYSRRCIIPEITGFLWNCIREYPGTRQGTTALGVSLFQTFVVLFVLKWTINRNLTFLLLTKCYSFDQHKKNEMGGVSGTYGGEFWRGNLRERDHLEDLGVDGWITLKWIFKKYDWVPD